VLSAEERAAVAELVYKALNGAVLAAPSPAEGEPSYTARVVQPILVALAAKLDIPGLVVGGHGTGPVHTVSFMGLQFIPDSELSYRGTRLIAIENKFIGVPHRQRQLTATIGQTAIYRLAGFEYAVGMLLDLATTTYSGYDKTPLNVDDRSVRFIVKRRNHLGQFVSQ
jgi:hypothetical protein